MATNRFTFSEGGHVYKLDGKRLTGVTTIIGVLDKPALVGWAANQAVDYIEKNFPTAEQLFKGEVKMSDVLTKARTAWRLTRDAAGDVGTQVHNAIEEYAKSKINSQPEPILSLTGHSLKMFQRFKQWAEDNKVTFLLSEQKLYSEKHWFAGTMDLLIEIDGRKYIADIKTAKDIYTSNYIQMAGYHIMLEEHGKCQDLAGYIVINLPKDPKRNGNAKFKEKRIRNTAQFKQMFMHCLALYKFLNKEKPSYLKKR